MSFCGTGCREKKRIRGRKRIAIITGASSGLGKEYVRLVSENEKNIDEIWLIARRKDRLQEAADAVASKTRCLSLDLNDDADIEKLRDNLEQTKHPCRSPY